MARSDAANLELRGGHPAVDLVNTVAWRGDPRRRTDYLSDYLDLVAWAHHAQVLSRREANVLAERAASEREAAAQTLRRTRYVREALHGIWTERESTRDADIVAAAFRSALRVKRLAVGVDVVEWQDSALLLQSPLHRLAIEAVNLLTAVPRSRIKRCADDECGWLFLDSSRRQNRRWCSTADCGNRARVRNFYERGREGLGS